MTGAIKYCPFCGSPKITYADDEVPYYVWCPDCETWISAADNFTLEEVVYIIQKVKAIRKMGEKLKEAKE